MSFPRSSGQVLLVADHAACAASKSTGLSISQ